MLRKIKTKWDNLWLASNNYLLDSHNNYSVFSSFGFGAKPSTLRHSR